MDDLEILLREHGGLEGLARELGQYGPADGAYEPAGNDNTPSGRGGFWRRVLALMGVRDARRRQSADIFLPLETGDRRKP
jgi:hypothetical protein